MRKILMMIIDVVLSVLLLTGCGLLPAQTQEAAAATEMILPESVPAGTNDTGETAEPAET